MKDSLRKTIEEKNIKRNRQLASLMIKNPSFQANILYWRKSLGIPEDGFSDGKSYDVYFRKKEKEFENKKEDNKFNYDKLYYGKYRVYFRIKVQKILEESGFMHNMAEVTEYYLCFNELPNCDSFYLRLPYPINFEDEFADPHTKLGIVIDHSTTLDEIKAAWPEIMQEQVFRKAAMPIHQLKECELEDKYDIVEKYKRKPQFREIKNMKRDELIIRLKEEGLSSKAIQRKIGKMGYGVIGYEYVSKIIKRYDARAGIEKA